jgi:hypothetical protein
LIELRAEIKEYKSQERSVHFKFEEEKSNLYKELLLCKDMISKNENTFNIELEEKKKIIEDQEITISKSELK